jgi:hypothetical protein
MKAKIKSAPIKTKRRTSIWLENDLRAKLDLRVTSTGNSLARVITDTLRKGLSKSKGDADAPATIFG